MPSILNSVYCLYKLINTLLDEKETQQQQTTREQIDSLKALLESEKSLVIEVLESNQNGQYVQPSLNINSNSELNGNECPYSKNPSKFFAERRRLRQLSQSALQLVPKFAIAIYIINYQDDLGDNGASQLAQWASAYNNVVELTLPNAGITEKGGKAIASMLMNECCCVKRINLAANNLGSEGVKHFLVALQTNKSLRSLNLGANSFSGDACNLEITRALSSNKTLLELDLSYNDIGDGGASALGFALRQTGGLEKLRLRRCGMNNNSAAKVLAVLAEPKSRLTHVDISVNSLSPLCCDAITKSLLNSRKVISCQLESCGVRIL